MKRVYSYIFLAGKIESRKYRTEDRGKRQLTPWNYKIYDIVYNLFLFHFYYLKMKNVYYKMLGCHRAKHIWPVLWLLLNSLIRKQTQFRVIQEQGLDNAAQSK